MINRMARPALLATVAAAWLLGSKDLVAQAARDAGRSRGGRNSAPSQTARRDPAQILQRQMERERELLEVQNDDEWKVIRERIEKVLQAQRELRVGRYASGRRGPTSRAGQTDGATPDRGRAGRGENGGAESNPDVAALQAALDSKAPPAEIKAKLAKLRETLKQKEAALTKAQEELRQVLSVRQEAIALLIGLLR